mgnify:CR=1 FL=1
MKISEIEDSIIAEYLVLDDYNPKLLNTIKSAALDYIKSGTGLTDEELDEHEALTIAYLAVIQDMYDNRQLEEDKKTYTNNTVDTILCMFSNNLAG